MFTYRITSQEDLGTVMAPVARTARSVTSAKPTSELIKANSITAALMNWGNANAHTKRKVVAVEELATWPDDTINDDLLLAAITDTDHYKGVDPTMVNDDDTPYDNDNQLIELAQDISVILSDNKVIPGLSLSIIGEPGAIGAMVEIFDVATSTYRSEFVKASDLTTNTHAVGLDGYVAIAKALVNRAQELM